MMSDDEYRRISLETHGRVIGSAAMVMIFSERLILDEIKQRGDTVMAARMRNAYVMLGLAAKEAAQQYENLFADTQP